MLNPDRVNLVRRRLGVTKAEFARQLGIDRKTLHRFESGEAVLSAEAVSTLSSLSGYPATFFSRSSFEYPNSAAISFRSMRSLTAGSRDTAIAAAALAFEFDDWIAERYELPAHDLPQLMHSAPALAAAHLRATWGIGERPIGNLMNLLEAHGVRVFSLAEETRHLDAYSFWRNDRPYIFLNTLKTAEHSRFDAAHELGHLVMHRHMGSGHSSGEQEANAFASAFLMPRGDLLAECARVSTLAEMIEKKKRWGVSVAALNYALFKAGKLSEWTYRSIYIELGKLGRSVEPKPMSRETSQVWTKILSDLWKQGKSLSRIAEELSIPERELSSLLFNVSAQSQPGPAGALRSLRAI